MKHIAALGLGLLTAGCMVGPDYHRPVVQMPVQYKELAGWVAAHPADLDSKGAWWGIYNDPLLNQLELRVALSNQNVKSFYAQFQEAREAVREAQAQLYPVLGATAGVTRQGFGSGSGGVGATVTGTTSGRGGGAANTYALQGTASWDLDVWGRIRRQIESNVAAAQVSAADLQNATLSAQGTLASDYMQLRYQDSLQDLLQATVQAYTKALRITSNQVAAGTTTPADEAAAETQLDSARATLINVGVARGQFEHAIAVLAGMAPADLTIAHAPLATGVPVPPPGLPATLLQRRPDIAAAERAMEEENALIGVQVAAYYPDISLSASYGWQSTVFDKLISAASRVWSLGASAGETIFQGGARSAAVAAARDAYDASVANYRQTVLTALQQVEDDLVALRILAQQAAAQDVAVRSAQRSVRIALNEYQAGTQAYTAVITQQTALFADQQADLSVRAQRLAASVALVQALGGGWDAAALPSKGSLQKGLPFL